MFLHPCRPAPALWAGLVKRFREYLIAPSTARPHVLEVILLLKDLPEFVFS
jgi:hypothetical protein